MAQIGAIQVSPFNAYDDNGYRIEQYGYWNTNEPFFAVPAWEEMGYPDLAAVFETKAAALKAIHDNNY